MIIHVHTGQIPVVLFETFGEMSWLTSIQNTVIGCTLKPTKPGFSSVSKYIAYCKRLSHLKNDYKIATTYVASYNYIKHVYFMLRLWECSSSEVALTFECLFTV